MQTIGLVKCKNKNIKYYNKISKDVLIDVNNLNIKQISSIVINTVVESSEFLKSINSLKLFIKINLRIIYLKHDDKSLYVFDKTLLELIYIDIPSNLDGLDSNLVFIKNKIKFDVFVENLSSKLINKEELLVNFFILVDLKVSPSFSIAYNIESNAFDNIFLSYYDGKNLTQETFTSDLDYSNISWMDNGSNIVFIASKDSTYYINNLDYTSKSLNKINSLRIENPINSFCFMKQNNILFSIKEDNKDILYTYNLKQNLMKKYKPINGVDNFTKPYYNNALNSLLCLCKINEINCLCEVDKQNNLSILFNFASVDDFLVNEDLNKAFIQVLKEEQLYFYTLALESKILTHVNFNFIYEKIIKIQYVKNKYSEEVLVVLYVYNSKSYLRTFNLNNFSSHIIYEDISITSFDINKNNLDIFIVVNNTVFSQVIKIDGTNNYEILKVPSNIKSISIR